MRPSRRGVIPAAALKKKREKQRNLNPSVLLNVDEPLQAAAAVITQDGLIDRLLVCMGEGGWGEGAARTWTEERKRDDTSTPSKSRSDRALRERKKELSRSADGCGRWTMLFCSWTSTLKVLRIKRNWCGAFVCVCERVCVFVIVAFLSHIKAKPPPKSKKEQNLMRQCRCSTCKVSKFHLNATLVLSRCRALSLAWIGPSSAAPIHRRPLVSVTVQLHLHRNMQLEAAKSQRAPNCHNRARSWKNKWHEWMKWIILMD